MMSMILHNTVTDPGLACKPYDSKFHALRRDTEFSIGRVRTSARDLLRRFEGRLTSPQVLHCPYEKT